MRIASDTGLAPPTNLYVRSELGGANKNTSSQMEQTSE